MSVATDFKAGDIVDRYRLLAPLGAGAFGQVWRAQKLVEGEEIGGLFAVKVMRLAADRGQSSSGAAAASGWLDEVKTLFRVSGGTIPTIDDAKVWNGHAYIAMELLEGETLAARIQRGPIPFRRALFIADQVAQALEVAHELKVIHRDLKPQNVILVGAARACVVDWGIARLNDASRTTAPSGIEPRSSDAPAATQTEDAPVQPSQQRAIVPIGTPGYIAPEVYEGARPAPAQDVFALGVLLFEMLTGRLPHKATRPDATASSPDSIRAYRSALDRATMDDAFEALAAIRPDVPSAVAELVEHMLARDPTKRPTHLREAIERVSRFPHGVPQRPYTGLTKLGLEHSGLFYGQDDAIHAVVKRFESQRAVLLWGPSGAGKSSLALAGVAASMDRRLFLGMDGWTIHVVRPREAQRLEVVAGDTALPAQRASGLGQVVIIDQLEEVVDLAPEARANFCDAVVALVEGRDAVQWRDARIVPGDTVRVLATIRDDLEWRVDREVPELRPLLDRRVIVKGVDANFAESMIAEPARTMGYTVEELGMVSREVAERLSADATKLPVVQFALSEWWERRDQAAKVLPIAAWRELGGVDGTLSFVAERLFSELDAQARERLRSIFLRFFVGQRRRAIAERDVDAADRAIIDRLVRLRLIGRRERKGEAPFYEVEHETLLTQWDRLRAWLDEAREDRLLAEEIEREASVWRSEKSEDRAWRKRRLIAAEDLIKKDDVRLSDDARDFVRMGRRVERRGKISLALLVASLVAAAGAGVAKYVHETAAARARAEEGERSANETAREMRIALRDSLAAQAESVVRSGGDAVTAIHLALRALAIDQADGNDSPATRRSLMFATLNGRVGVPLPSSSIPAVFSSDGNEVFVAVDRSIHAYDTRTGTEYPGRLMDFSAAVERVAMMHGGLLVVLTEDGAIARRNAATGVEVWKREIAADVWSTRTGMGLSGNGARALVPSLGHERVLDTASANVLHDIEVDKSTRSEALSSDGNLLALAGASGISVWDISAAQGESRRWSSPGADVRCLVFSPDAKRLAVCRRDRVDVLDAGSGTSLGAWQVAYAKEVTWSYDGRRVSLSGGSLRQGVTSEGGVMPDAPHHSLQLGYGVLDAATGAPLSALYGISDMSFSPNGALIAGRDADADVLVDSTVVSPTIKLADGSFVGVTSRRLAICDPTRMHTLDPKTGAVDKTWAEAALSSLDVCGFTADGRFGLAFTDVVTTKMAETRHATIIDLDSMRKVGEFEAGAPQDSSTGSMSVAPSGSRVVVALQHGLGVFDLPASAPAAVLSASLPASFSSDGKRLATACDGGVTVCVWNGDSGALVRKIGTNVDVSRLSDEDFAKGFLYGAVLTDVRLSADGKRVAVATGERTAHVWNADTAASVATLTDSTDAIARLWFSPDGSRLLSTSTGAATKVWDASSGAQVATLGGLSQRVVDASFSPDGSRVVTTALDRSATVWDAKTGAVIASFVAGAGAFASRATARFVDDGDHVVALGSDLLLRSFDVDFARNLEYACLVTRRLDQDAAVRALCKGPLARAAARPSRW